MRCWGHQEKKTRWEGEIKGKGKGEEEKGCSGCQSDNADKDFFLNLEIKKFIN